MIVWVLQRNITGVAVEENGVGRSWQCHVLEKLAGIVLKECYVKNLSIEPPIVVLKLGHWAVCHIMMGFVEEDAIGLFAGKHAAMY
jgi:hypothetical protein